MSQNRWKQIVKDREIPAKPAGGLWTMVHEIVTGPCLVKIEAEGTWQYADEKEAKCGPDGQVGSYLSASRCINDKAPVGALVAKVGGSTADQGGKETFVAGSFCVAKLEAKSGALFLTINDVPAGYADNQGKLKIQVYTKDLPPGADP